MGPICMILEVLGEIALPYLMSVIINRGVANHDIRTIVLLGCGMIGIACIMAGGGIGGAYFASHASIPFGADLRLDLFQKVQKFSFQNIDTFSTGSLVTRLTNDITQVQNIIMMIMRTCLRAPGMLIGALVMAFAMNAGLAVIILTVIPLWLWPFLRLCVWLFRGLK